MIRAAILLAVVMLTDSRGNPMLSDVSQRGVLEQHDSGIPDAGASVPVLDAGHPPRCEDNLCVWDSYCSCSPKGCWATRARCEFFAECTEHYKELQYCVDKTLKEGPKL